MELPATAKAFNARLACYYCCVEHSPYSLRPNKWKVGINQINGRESGTNMRLTHNKLRLSHKKLIIYVDKSFAEAFRLSVTGAIIGPSAKVQTKKFYGLLKGIPSDLELSHLISCPGVFDASRLGKSTAVKLEFSDVTSRAHAFRYGLKIAYENLRGYPVQGDSPLL